MLPPLTFLPSARHMAVALSGGVDSLVTLHHLRRAVPQGTVISALYINHHQRAASSMEAKIIQRWCQNLGVPFCSLDLNEPMNSDAATLRRARYRAMITWCHAHHHPVLITGHHRDDQNETFLIAAQRGSGLDGLAGMRPTHTWWGIQVVRPLLMVTKEQIVAEARALGLRWIEDPSNEKMSFLRNRLRAALMDTPHHLETTIGALTATRDYFDHHVDAFFRQHIQIFPEGYITLPYPALIAQDGEIARRVLKQALRLISGKAVDPRFARLSRATWALYQTPKQTLSLHGCIVTSTPEKILIYREAQAIDPTPLPADQPHLWDQRFFCQANEPSAYWAALGAEGYESIRPHLKAKQRPLRYAVALTQPALWSTEDRRVLAAPTLDYAPEERTLRVFFLGHGF
jgi:tRNA(Ile)-lysidine synthase